MGKEDGDNRVMARVAGGEKVGPGMIPPFILPIDIQRGIVPENTLHLFHFSILGCASFFRETEVGRRRRRRTSKLFFFF